MVSPSVPRKCTLKEHKYTKLKQQTNKNLAPVSSYKSQDSYLTYHYSLETSICFSELGITTSLILWFREVEEKLNQKYHLTERCIIFKADAYTYTYMKYPSSTHFCLPVEIQFPCNHVSFSIFTALQQQQCKLQKIAKQLTV